MEILMQMRKAVQSFDALKVHGISDAATPSSSVILAWNTGLMMQLLLYLLVQCV